MEQALGRLKGRWKIKDVQCKKNYPVFVHQVAMVYCVMHSMSERHQWLAA